MIGRTLCIILTLVVIATCRANACIQPEQRVEVEATSFRGRMIDYTKKAVQGAAFSVARIDVRRSSAGPFGFEYVSTILRRGETGVDGSFSLSNLAPGTYVITIHTDSDYLGWASFTLVVKRPEKERNGFLRVVMIGDSCLSATGFPVTW